MSEVSQTSQFARGWVDLEASVSSFIPRLTLVLTPIGLLWTSAKTQDVVESSSTIYNKERVLLWATLDVHFMMYIDFITVTKLNFSTYGSNTVRQNSGEWWTESTTLRREGKLWNQDLWEIGYTSRKDQIGIFWGFRSMLHLFTTK